MKVLFNTQKRHAVLVFDGEHWHAGIWARAKSDWRCEASVAAGSHNMKQLPADLLDWLQERQATHARVLVPADLHSMPLTMPDDFDSEELHTALTYEIAGELGTESHLLRLASAEAATYGMGGERGVYLAAGFDLGLVEGYALQLGRADIRFEGVGALELGMLAAHAQTPDNVLLLLRNRSGFLAVPGSETRPFAVMPLQVGLIATGSDHEAERIARLRRRLPPENGLSVVTATGHEHDQNARVTELLGADTPFQLSPLDDRLHDVMRTALAAAPGDCRAACPLIGPPPVPRDPYRAGTWIALAVLLLTITYITTRWTQLQTDLRTAEARIEFHEKLSAERTRLKNRSEQLLARRNNLMAVHRVLSETRMLPEGLLATLDVLASSMPPHTRISRLEQTAPNAFTLHGMARWAEGKNQLGRSLMDELRPLGFEVEHGRVELLENTREQSFSYTIVYRGGAR